MEYDALIAGVEPGGLNNTQQIRLLVCYILRAIKTSISRTMLPEILQYEGLANLFEVIDDIDRMIEEKKVEVIIEDGQEMLITTEKGNKAAKELEFMLPFTVKKKAVRAAVAMLTKIRVAKENKVNIIPVPTGYNVECIVTDRDMELLKIVLWVPDTQQAEVVKTAFMEDPMRVYGGSISLLLGTELAPPKEEEY